jgi:DNA-binding transcriptional ArsR family regulator
MYQQRDFAKPIVATIEALNSEQRRRILIDLEEAGSLSYSEILQRTGLDKGTLNYHLKKLVASGLVRNFLREQGVSFYTSYYEVSEFGRHLIEGLLNAFKPPQARLRIPSATTTSYELWLPPQRGARETPDTVNPSSSEAIGESREYAVLPTR